MRPTRPSRVSGYYWVLPTVNSREPKRNYLQNLPSSLLNMPNTCDSHTKFEREHNLYDPMPKNSYQTHDIETIVDTQAAKKVGKGVGILDPFCETTSGLNMDVAVSHDTLENATNYYDLESFNSGESTDSNKIFTPLDNSIQLGINNSWPSRCQLTPWPPVKSIQQSKNCRIWKRTNEIYGRISNIGIPKTRAVNELGVGTLFKAMNEGWEALSEKELNNPILQILKGIDQEMLPNSDPTTKLAVMYKNQLLLKVRLHSSSSFM